MNNTELFVKMAMHLWNTQIGQISRFVQGLSDEQWFRDIAPGKNRGIYVVGHFLAIHDAMNTILGTGQRNYAHLDAVFVQNPDKSGLEMPSIEELKTYWDAVHASLDKSFALLPADEWLSRHNNMTDDDFVKDPARNKLAVLLNRANHAAYHFGQLRLIK